MATDPITGATIPDATTAKVTNAGLINQPLTGSTTSGSSDAATTNPTTPVASAVAATPQVTASTYTPAQTTLDASDTVAGRVNSIINSGSDLMQSAKTGALEQMNGRGLLNSSMAVGAAQKAMVDSATPIAAQDAQTSASTKNQNTAAQNTAAQANATANNQAALTNADLQSKTSQFNASQSNDLIKAGLSADTQTHLANIEADYKTLMQTSQSAADMYRQTIGSIGSILADTNMNAAAKATAINGLTGYLKAGMNIVGAVNGVDLGNLLNFGTVTAS